MVVPNVLKTYNGGVWGTLHNKSVSPKLELSRQQLTEGILSFDLMRVEGADVYGSFVYKLEIIDSKTAGVIYQIRGEDWKSSRIEIKNHHIAKIKEHDYSLIVPLGAKATITLPVELSLNKDLLLKLTDINGKSWSLNI